MTTITNNEFPEGSIDSKSCLVLFGNQQCNVCTALKLKLQTVIEEKLPEVKLLYVDTQINPILAANHTIFTAPVIAFFSHQREYHRWVRSFSIKEIIDYCNRMLEIQNS